MNNDYLVGTIYKQVNELQTAQCLKTSEGVITESVAIMRYLSRISNNQLYGNDDYERGLIDQWLDFYSADIFPTFSLFSYQCHGVFMPQVKQCKKTMELGQAMFKSKLDSMNKYIFEGKRTYLVGNSLSLADIALACALELPFAKAYGEKERKPAKATVDWLVNLSKENWFISVYGRLRLCSKPLPVPQLPDEEEVGEVTSKKKADAASKKEDNSKNTKK